MKISWKSMKFYANLKKDLENVAKRIRTLGKASLVRFLQHFVSYLIFGAALMIDYKGNPSNSTYSNPIIHVNSMILHI